MTMGYYVVINEAGPAWDDKRSMREQEGWPEHAEFMDSLEAKRLVVMGGPLKGYSKHRALLILHAADELSLKNILAEDPWMQTGVLNNVGFYSWEIILGKQLLQSNDPLETAKV